MASLSFSSVDIAANARISPVSIISCADYEIRDIMNDAARALGLNVFTFNVPHLCHMDFIPLPVLQNDGQEVDVFPSTFDVLPSILTGFVGIGHLTDTAIDGFCAAMKNRRAIWAERMTQGADTRALMEAHTVIHTDQRLETLNYFSQIFPQLGEVLKGMEE